MNARVRVGHLSLGWSGRAELRDLSVVPRGFDAPLLLVRRAELKVSPGSALRGRLVGRAIVHDPEVFLERDARGRANYDVPEAARRPRERRPRRAGEVPEIDFRLEVRNGRLRARGVGADAAPGDETARARFERLQGTLRSGRGAVSGRAALTGFEWIDPRTIVREPDASLVFDLRVSASQVEIRAFALKSGLVRGDSAGVVSTGAAGESSLRGSFRYVPEWLGAVASPWLPVRLEGAEPLTVEFELAGRAAGAGLAGVLRGARGFLAADVPRLSRPGWNASGRVRLDLDGGILRGEAPLELNGGRADLRFNVDVREPLRASKGTLALQARDVAASSALSPLLEKVSPLFFTVGGELSGTVEADFEFTWEGVPDGGRQGGLASASRALKGRGRLGVRALRVSGSPALDALADAFGLAGRRLEGELRPVEISIEGGRCRYEGMTFLAGRLPLRFDGWVAFDREMDLTVEVPVGERLARRFPALSRILGRAIRVPLRGRLDRPQLDLEGALSGR
jgi:hypothetical protein